MSIEHHAATEATSKSAPTANAPPLAERESSTVSDGHPSAQSAPVSIVAAPAFAGPDSSRRPSATSRSAVMSGAAPLADISTAQRHCRFVLLAEFDIDKGSTLSHQYPEPTAYDEHMLAELMLPDGAHARVEDWTVFFLKSPGTGGLSKARKSSDKQPRGPSSDSLHQVDSNRRKDEDWSSDGLTYVINLVRTKHDNTVRRGALVKSMAVGTRHPFIDIFKPILLLALDDYFKEPSIDCLARLYEAINRLNLSPAPAFTRSEKLILRASDRRDFFEERFSSEEDSVQDDIKLAASQAPDDAAPAAMPGTETSRQRADSGSTVSEDMRSIKKKHSVISLRPNAGARRGSSAASLKDLRPSQPSPLPSKGKPRDTHFYDTTIGYRQVFLPIRVPLTTFPEEVGEYSLIKLIQTFSGPQSHPQGPLHPHLHSNGALTHPIILLFNALVTQKRVVFLGHGQPANLVASYVLAACALGSGCGAVFRGFASRAFPYTNLMNLDELEKVPGYIAGVTNPRFEDLHAWDVLLNVETGKIQVAKDIPLPPPLPVASRSQMTRDVLSSGSLSSLAGNTSFSHETTSKASSEFDTVREFGAMPAAASTIKSTSLGRDRSGTLYDSRVDSPNNLFMDDVASAIQAHYGERYIRARITDFVAAFAKAVARHEEHFYGFTKLGSTSQPFLNGQLGSGPVYADREAEMREIVMNQVRVEGFRASIPFKFYAQDEQDATLSRSSLPFDLSHQVARLKRARQLLPGEAELIFTTISTSIASHLHIVELLSLLPSHAGGLLPLGFGLFHPDQHVRTLVVDLFLRLCAHPVGKKFVQSLNTYHRLAFVRLAGERLEGLEKEKAAHNTDGKNEKGEIETEQQSERDEFRLPNLNHPFRTFTPTSARDAES